MVLCVLGVGVGVRVPVAGTVEHSECQSVNRADRMQIFIDACEVYYTIVE